MKRFLVFLAPALLFVPTLAFAQATPNLGYFDDWLSSIGTLLAAAMPVLITLAVVAILFGLARYAFAAGNEEAQTQGRRIMVTGVIILFVMLSIWGLVALLQNVTGISDTTAPPAPEAVQGTGTGEENPDPGNQELTED